MCENTFPAKNIRDDWKKIVWELALSSYEMCPSRTNQNRKPLTAIEIINFMFLLVVCYVKKVIKF
jgi:hypothetical protein